MLGRPRVKTLVEACVAEARIELHLKFCMGARRGWWILLSLEERCCIDITHMVLVLVVGWVGWMEGVKGVGAGMEMEGSRGGCRRTPVEVGEGVQVRGDMDGRCTVVRYDVVVFYVYDVGSGPVGLRKWKLRRLRGYAVCCRVVLCSVVSCRCVYYIALILFSAIKRSFWRLTARAMSYLSYMDVLIEYTEF